ncbi:MAG: hypothetical protein KDC44_17025 [Phaeodactylibacter sp.]|nr:hypothetical protein [Phaeodactylibacter sp.]
MEQKFYTQIEDYLKGRLSEEDRKQFEAALLMDAALSSEVALQRDLIAATRELDVLQLRSAIRDSLATDTLPKKTHQKPRKPGSGWLNWLVLSLFLLGGAYLIYRAFNSNDTNPVHQDLSEPKALPNDSTEKQFSEPLQMDRPTSGEQDQKPAPPVAENKTTTRPAEKQAEPSTPNPELIALATELYREQPYSVQLKSADPDADKSLLAQAEAAYADKDFRAVIGLLEKPEPGFETESAKLRAHALFQLGQYDQAAKAFQGLAKGFYKYDAQWYRLLALLPGLPGTQKEVDALIKEILDNPTHAFRTKTEKVDVRIE